MSALGHPRLHLRTIGSTNERARELALAGAPHGTLVSADEQTAGRGRHGRVWIAPAGEAVLMSLLLRDLDDDRRRGLLPLAAAVAVAAALGQWLDEPGRVTLKWPNDVWVDRLKIAGILLEGRPQEGWAVLGTGINVATSRGALAPKLRDRATSLAIASGSAPAVEDVRAATLAELGEWLAATPDAVRERWSELDALRGSTVHWGDGEGTAAGIDERGGLIVERGGGTVHLDAGEVHLVL